MLNFYFIIITTLSYGVDTPKFVAQVKLLSRDVLNSIAVINKLSRLII